MSDLILYTTEDGQSRIQLRADGQTIWDSQREMAELFNVSTDNVGLHLKNIYADGELSREATTEDSSVVQTEGDRGRDRHPQSPGGHLSGNRRAARQTPDPDAHGVLARQCRADHQRHRWCGSFLTAPYAEITEVDLHHLEFIAMHHITINIKDDRLAKQVVWWLEHFKDDGLEIVSVEDLEDLKALQATRQEASVSFEDYLSHAD